MVPRDHRIWGLEEAFGMKNLSSEREEAVPEDTQLPSGGGYLGLLLAPLPISRQGALRSSQYAA